MMYNNKLACAIKVDGSVLREDGEVVKLPFGSEYSFYIKNLHSRRASVSISIDGEDIADGDTFVVKANSSINIERFLRGNNSHGNRFKFIERTTKIEAHRGIDAEDGLIRVEYQFERPTIKHQVNHYPSSSDLWTTTTTQTFYNMDTKGTTGDALYQANQPRVTASSSLRGTPVSKSPANDVGVTVEGSISDQTFQTVSTFPLEAEKHVMVFRLIGVTEDNTPIVEPVTTKTRVQCPKCARVVKPNDKFCYSCGAEIRPAPRTCKSCGTEVNANDKFCTECGTSTEIVS